MPRHDHTCTHAHAQFVAGLKYFACTSKSWVPAIDPKIFPVVAGVAVPPTFLTPDTHGHVGHESQGVMGVLVPQTFISGYSTIKHLYLAALLEIVLHGAPVSQHSYQRYVCPASLQKGVQLAQSSLPQQELVSKIVMLCGWKFGDQRG